MRVLIAVLTLAAMVAPELVSAQASRVYTPPQVSPCKTVQANRENAGVDYTVDALTVMVLRADTTRCGAIIANVQTAGMRCHPLGKPLSQTEGVLIQAGAALVLGLEGQEQWNCTRATGVSTGASVSEARP